MYLPHLASLNSTPENAHVFFGVRHNNLKETSRYFSNSHYHIKLSLHAKPLAEINNLKRYNAEHFEQALFPQPHYRASNA